MKAHLFLFLASFFSFSVCGTKWPSQYIHSLYTHTHIHSLCGSSQNSVTKIYILYVHALFEPTGIRNESWMTLDFTIINITYAHTKHQPVISLEQKKEKRISKFTGVKYTRKIIVRKIGTKSQIMMINYKF